MNRLPKQIFYGNWPAQTEGSKPGCRQCVASGKLLGPAESRPGLAEADVHQPN